jgi:hypothetical protein
MILSRPRAQLGHCASSNPLTLRMKCAADSVASGLGAGIASAALAWASRVALQAAASTP